MAFQHIVVLTDFSPAANDALRAATDIARRSNGATVHLIHVYEQPYATLASNGAMAAVLDTAADAALRKTLREQMETQVREVKADGVHFTSRLLHDIPVHHFHKHLEGYKPDLIVVGARGDHSAVYDALIGSNAVRIIRTANAPVLAVPQGARLDPVRHMVLATDFGLPVAPFMPQLAALVRLFDSKVDVVAISTRERPLSSQHTRVAFEQLERQYKDVPMQLHIQAEEDVETGINLFLNKTNADLLAMVTHGRTGFSRLLNGSITEDMSKLVYVPLLAFRATA